MKRMKKTILMVCILVITIIASSICSVMGIRHLKYNFHEEEYRTIAAGIYGAVENAIARPIVTAQAMASDIFLMEMLQNEESYNEAEAVAQLTLYLSHMKSSMHAQTAFVISDNTKRYYTSDGLNKVLDLEHDEHDVWYSIFVNTRKSYDIDVDVDQANGNVWTVFVNSRIEDEDGRLLGVCGVGIAMDELQTVLQEYEGKYSIKVNFVNEEGLVQVDTDAVNIENAYLYDVQYGKEKDGYAYQNKDGEYVVMRYIDSLNWYLVIHGIILPISFSEIMHVMLGNTTVILVNVIAFYFLYFRRDKEKETYRRDKEKETI